LIFWQSKAEQTSVRDYLEGEKVIHGFVLDYLNVTDYYLTLAERELGMGLAVLYLDTFWRDSG
jgi:hypothetical protein